METERVIDLKDLMYWALKKWRGILAGAVILAVLLGLFQAWRGLRSLGGDAAAERQKAYESELEDYTLKREQLQASVDKLQEQLDVQSAYNEKSVLMQIDPMNKWVSSIQIYVDSKYKIDPSLSYQNTDRTGRLVSAYASLLNSSEVYDALIKQSPDVDEIRFLKELYEVKTDPGDAIITVSFAGTAKQAVQQMPELVKEELAAQQKTLRDTIGEHSYMVLTESVYSVMDPELESTQEKNLQAITDYAQQIRDAKQALTDLEKEEPKLEVAGKRSLIKPVIKYAVIGFVAGAVIMCVWFAARYALSDSLKTDEDLRRWKLPVLGRITRERQKKKLLPGLDALVDRIFGRTCRSTTEQSCALAAQILSAALKQQGCAEAALVGRLPEDLTEILTRQLNAAESGVSFRCVGDALTDPAAARALEGSDQVLLLAERYVTPCAEVEQTLTLLTAWGKTALGAVVVE